MTHSFQPDQTKQNNYDDNDKFFYCPDRPPTEPPEFKDRWGSSTSGHWPSPWLPLKRCSLSCSSCWVWLAHSGACPDAAELPHYSRRRQVATTREPLVDDVVVVAGTPFWSVWRGVHSEPWRRRTGTAWSPFRRPWCDPLWTPAFIWDERNYSLGSWIKVTN